MYERTHFYMPSKKKKKDNAASICQKDTFFFTIIFIH